MDASICDLPSGPEWRINLDQSRQCDGGRCQETADCSEMTVGISLIPGRTGAHRTPLQLDSHAIQEFFSMLLEYSLYCMAPGVVSV
jgi:hypothetical protein